jgi:uncharacterized membrane protein
MCLAIYLIGMMIMLAITAMWAGVSNKDTEDKFGISCLVAAIAMAWPIALPLGFLYYCAKLVKRALANKDI